MTDVEPVIINLDKPRTARLTLHAMRKLKTEHGLNVLAGLPEDTYEDPDKVATLLWACLIHEDKALTIDAVAEMIDTSNLIQVVSTVTKALQMSMPEPKKEESPNAASPSSS